MDLRNVQKQLKKTALLIPGEEQKKSEGVCRSLKDILYIFSPFLLLIDLNHKWLNKRGK
jgi:hypothetical protein